MLPNSWDIDAAVIGLLAADAALQALLPDGVFYALAPPNATRFVLVKLEDSTDTNTFDGRDMEANRYRVEGTGLSSALTEEQSKAAAYRIDQLLGDQPVTIAGYVGAVMVRDGRIRDKVPTPADASIVWFYGGGFYRVEASLTKPIATLKGVTDHD